MIQSKPEVKFIIIREMVARDNNLHFTDVKITDGSDSISEPHVIFNRPNYN